jgi:hypothetical protein
MSSQEDGGTAVRSALDALDSLFELADEHFDTDALACPTMSPEVLEMVGDFLASSVVGDMSFDEVRHEARMWLETALAGWPFESPTALVLLQALQALAETPPQDSEEAQPDPPAGTPLERAIAAVVEDPATRPALWKALWYGTIFLPVADVDFDADEHAVFRFVTVDIGRETAILGFTTEERLDLVATAEPVGRVEPTGEELARLWPDNHWLILNPGFSVSTTFSAGEIKGLPDGPSVFVPEEVPYTLEAPPADDARLAALRDARHTLEGVSELHWAVIRTVTAKAKNVFVVRTHDPKQTHAVLASLSAAAARAGFDDALVVAAEPEHRAGLTVDAVKVGLVVD